MLFKSGVQGIAVNSWPSGCRDLSASIQWKESWLLQDVTGVTCEDHVLQWTLEPTSAWWRHLWVLMADLGGGTQPMSALVPYVCEGLSWATSICHTDLGLWGCGQERPLCSRWQTVWDSHCLEFHSLPDPILGEISPQTPETHDFWYEPFWLYCLL